jgi:hypothetical protein
MNLPWNSALRIDVDRPAPHRPMKRETSMTNFSPVEPDVTTGKTAELLAQVRKSLGRPPT